MTLLKGFALRTSLASAGISAAIVGGGMFFGVALPLMGDLREERRLLTDERREHDITRTQLSTERANATEALDRALIAERAERRLSRELDEARTLKTEEVTAIAVEAERELRDADPEWGVGPMPERSRSVRLQHQCDTWRAVVGTDHPNCGSASSDERGAGEGTPSLRTDAG